MDSLPKNQPIQIDTFPDEPEPNSGPGCFLWGIIGVICIIFACMIVFLSAALGINQGTNIGKLNATTTHVAYIATQCQFLSSDLSAGRTNLLDLRFAELSRENPVPACVEQHAPVATSLFLANLPTLTPALTSTATETSTPQVTDTPEATQAIGVKPTTEPAPIETTTSSSGYDLQSLFDEAQGYVINRQWSDAVDTLDAINAIDPQFRTSEIQDLITQALVSSATEKYRSGELAQAVLLTDRAEQYGDIGELNYERFIANMYLDAERFAGFNYNEAIRLLRRIIYEQGLQNYMNGEAMNLLVDQYIAFGDAFTFEGRYCDAVTQYQNALNVRNSPLASSKLNSNQILCDQQNSIQPFGTPASGTIIPPVGAPGG